jgi:hypothetical protein
MANHLNSTLRPKVRHRARVAAWVNQRERQAREWTELHEAELDDELDELIDEEDAARTLGGEVNELLREKS